MINEKKIIPDNSISISNGGIEPLKNINDNVLSTYYGCGLVIPDCLEKMNVLDLGCGSGHRNNVLNYQQKDYNNYQSWSNVGRGNIKISSVDENGNV